LIAGCAIAATSSAGCRVWGVEPDGGDDVAKSLQAGRRIEIPVPRTIADGQQLVTPGERPFAVVQRYVDGVVTVSDSDIIEAMRLLFIHGKVVAEPSGACALAALVSQRLNLSGRRVGVVVSGGNIDAERFCALLA
jgi:threonine dehydratase